jgi:hypothetical protein
LELGTIHPTEANDKSEMPKCLGSLRKLMPRMRKSNLVTIRLLGVSRGLIRGLVLHQPLEPLLEMLGIVVRFKLASGLLELVDL